MARQWPVLPLAPSRAAEMVIAVEQRVSRLQPRNKAATGSGAAQKPVKYSCGV